MVMNKRIAIYLRVSTEGQSTDLQRSEIDLYMKSKGWANFVVYGDKLSGTTVKRPGLQKMLNDARNGSFDVLICWKLDRLFRSLKDLITTLNELSELKIDFISVKDNIDMTTASGRLLAHMLGAIGQFEADLIKMRVVAGLAEARRKGIRLGRPTTVSIDDVRLLRSQGLSLNQIATKLKVSKSAVHKCLLKSSGHKRSINTEIIEVQKSNLAVDKTNVLNTNDSLPQQRGLCHEAVNLCHEMDLFTSNGKDE
jgi:DNA invertase Pin-like site-specific DNA recombinase